MRTIDAYSNSEITNAINSVISNKYDRHIIYSRLVRGETWQDLSVFASKIKRHYERLCSKVIIKLLDECWEGEKMTNKEAIKLIQGIEEDGRNITTEHVEALDLAINVLEDIEILRYRLEVLEHNSNLGDEVEMKGDTYKKGKTDLCETCKKGDVCEISTKIFSDCCTSKCYKYEKGEEE